MSVYSNNSTGATGDLSAQGQPAPGLPIKAKRPPASPKAKAQPFGQDEAARLVLAIAKSKTSPPKATLDRLDQVWKTGASIAKTEGQKGLGQFLEWIEEQHPDRHVAIKTAIEAAEVGPLDDDDDDLEPGDSEVRRTDLGNARRLVKRFGDRIRYHVAWREWLIWDGRRWNEDRQGRIVCFAKSTVEKIFREAAAARDESTREALAKWAIASQNCSRIKAMIELAKTEPGIPVNPDELDAHDMLFNVLNGTLDLRSGILREHRRKDMLTMLSPTRYDPQAKCPLWDGFLDKFLGAEAGIIDFLRRAAGYAMTGDTSEQCMFFPFGDGANGKSTFLLTLNAVFGDYSRTIDPKILTAKDHDQHSTELCDLDGPRLIITVEVEDGQRMAESLLKRVTGGDSIRARRMRKDPYEFVPHFKLFMAANHKPSIRGTDFGIWRRIRMIPFEYTISEAEKVSGFGKQLEGELPGILAWCLRGCLEWQSGGGLRPPEVVTQATEEYRREQDGVQRFIDKCCVVDPSYRGEHKTLYGRYKDFRAEEGERFTMTDKAFALELGKKGFVVRPSNNKTWRIGLAIAEQDHPNAKF